MHYTKNKMANTVSLGEFLDAYSREAYEDESKLEEDRLYTMLSAFEDGSGIFANCAEYSQGIHEPPKKKCVACGKTVCLPKTTLLCKCEYHLECVLKIANEDNQCKYCKEVIDKKTEEDYSECSICLEKIKEAMEVTFCKHKFHENCLHTWKLMKGLSVCKCPLCRAVL